MRLKSYENIGEQVLSQTLPNGLQVYVIPKPGYSKAYAFFATNYGGVDRRFRLGGKWIDTPEGVAHFLEHKMFDMPGGNALMELSANGASPNAFTSGDITAYHFQCTEKFYENLRTLLTFVSTPYFTDESVDKEQGIIGQEIRMGDDDADRAVYYNMMKCLYESHPLRYSVAGTVESISEITAKTLYDCHKVFYNPSNMVLCVEGDVDPDKVIDMCLEILPREPGEVPVRDYGDDETKGLKPYMERLECDMAISRPLFFIGCKTSPVPRGRDFLARNVAAGIALDVLLGDSSKLYNDLYASGLIGGDFGAAFETVAGSACTIVGGQSDDPERVFDRVRETVADAAKNGVDEALFQRVKKATYGGLLRRLNSFDAVCYDYSYGYFNGYDEFTTAKVLEDATMEQVMQFIKTDLSPENMAISRVNPKG